MSSSILRSVSRPDIEQPTLGGTNQLSLLDYPTPLPCTYSLARYLS